MATVMTRLRSPGKPPSMESIGLSPAPTPPSSFPKPSRGIESMQLSPTPILRDSANPSAPTISSFLSSMTVMQPSQSKAHQTSAKHSPSIAPPTTQMVMVMTRWRSPGKPLSMASIGGKSELPPYSRSDLSSPDINSMPS